MKKDFDAKAAFRKLPERILTVAATGLPPAQVKALRPAEKRETVIAAKAQLKTIVKNIEMARETCGSICQDPGLFVLTLRSVRISPSASTSNARLRMPPHRSPEKFPCARTFATPLAK